MASWAPEGKEHALNLWSVRAQRCLDCFHLLLTLSTPLWFPLLPPSSPLSFPFLFLANKAHSCMRGYLHSKMFTTELQGQHSPIASTTRTELICMLPSLLASKLYLTLPPSNKLSSSCTLISWLV